MAWNLKGQLVESCSCNMFCPCWFGVQDLMVMDQGWCGGVLGFRVGEGVSDGVDLDGREVVLAAHFPGPTMFDGSGTARLLIDDAADDAQHQALETIFQGKAGGPMEVIASLMSTWLPTEKADIVFSLEGETITMSVDGVGDVSSQLLRDPDGNAFNLTGGGFITGFGMESVDLAPAPGRWSDSELPVQWDTRSGARGDFVWAA